MSEKFNHLYASMENEIFGSTPCPTMDELIQYAENKLSPNTQYKIEEHLTDCDLCLLAIESLALIEDKENLKEEIQLMTAKLKEKEALSSQTGLERLLSKAKISKSLFKDALPISQGYFLRWLQDMLFSLKGLPFGSPAAQLALLGCPLLLLSQQSIKVWPLALQSIIILLIYVYLKWLGPKPQYHEKYQRASVAILQFWRWWPNVWLTWLAMYLSLTFFAVKTIEINSFTEHWLFNIINNLNTLLILICHHILNDDTVEVKSPQETSLAPQAPPLIPAFVGTNFSSSILDEVIKPAKIHWKWIGYIILGLLTALEFVLVVSDGTLLDYADLRQSFANVFELSAGIVSAIALFMLVSRFTSKYLPVPRTVIIILALYISIQPIFTVIVLLNLTTFNTLSFKAFVIITALIGKVLLFLLIQWLVFSNNLLFYMIGAADLNKGIDSIRKDFISKLHQKKI